MGERGPQNEALGAPEGVIRMILLKVLEDLGHFFGAFCRQMYPLGTQIQKSRGPRNTINVSTVFVPIFDRFGTEDPKLWIDILKHYS